MECSFNTTWMVAVACLRVSWGGVFDWAPYQASGLPVGLQIVGRPGDDAAVLQAAAVLEQELAEAGLTRTVPVAGEVAVDALFATEVLGPTTLEAAAIHHGF
jgi:hypothetical protein